MPTVRLVLLLLATSALVYEQIAELNRITA